jgi:hypothetical protein
VIAWPWLDVTDVQGLGFRLRVAAFVPMALAGAVVVGKLVARVKYRDIVLAALSIVLAVRAPGDRAEGRIDAHPAMVSAVLALGNTVPAEDTIIVPERHIVYMVAWYTRHAVRILPASVPAEHRWRLVPLAWVGFDSPLDRALIAARTERRTEPRTEPPPEPRSEPRTGPRTAPRTEPPPEPQTEPRTGPRTESRPPIGLHPRHPNGLVLMKEETWQRVLATLPEDIRTAWSRWRPN